MTSRGVPSEGSNPTDPFYHVEHFITDVIGRVRPASQDLDAIFETAALLFTIGEGARHLRPAGVLNT